MADRTTGQPGTGPDSTESDVEKLIGDLASEDGLTRVRARQKLVDIGEPAVDHLVKALQDKREWMRWEAAKTLSQIGSPAATQALIVALEDKMFDVRWLSAEGLINIGRRAIPPLLHALAKNAESGWLREGAHHVLHGIQDEGIKKKVGPLIAALEYGAQTIRVPLAAEQALDALGHGEYHGRQAARG
jgi:HEAT repeat protein